MALPLDRLSGDGPESTTLGRKYSKGESLPTLFSYGLYVLNWLATEPVGGLHE
jgi:hypothetical protein